MFYEVDDLCRLLVQRGYQEDPRQTRESDGGRFLTYVKSGRKPETLKTRPTNKLIPEQEYTAFCKRIVETDIEIEMGYKPAEV